MGRHRPSLKRASQRPPTWRVAAGGGSGSKNAMPCGPRTTSGIWRPSGRWIVGSETTPSGSRRAIAWTGRRGPDRPRRWVAARARRVIPSTTKHAGAVRATAHEAAPRSGAAADREVRLAVRSRSGVKKTTQPATRPIASQPIPAARRPVTARDRIVSPGRCSRRWFNMARSWPRRDPCPIPHRGTGGRELGGALRHQYGRIRSQLVRPGYLRPDPRTIYPDAATDDARWGGGSSPDSPETG